MPINLNQLPTEQTVQIALQEGEGQQIELMQSVAASSHLGRIMSSFANATGGAIFIGIKEHPRTVVGCDYQRVNSIFSHATDHSSPAPIAAMHRIEMPQGDVAVVIVQPHNGVVFSQAGAFIREGATTRIMTAEELQARLPVQQAQPQGVQQIAVAFAETTATLTRLEAKLEQSQTWRGQIKGFCVGVVASVVAAGVVAVIVYLYDMAQSVKPQ